MHVNTVDAPTADGELIPKE